MCKAHWYAVPQPIRDEVWRTWKALQRRKTPDTIQAYRAAREHAIDAVGEKQDAYYAPVWDR